MAVIFFPLRLSFYNESENISWLIVSIALDSIFMIDIVLNFFSAYFNDEEKLVYNKQQLSCNYLKTWFIIDIISAAPFYLIHEHGIFNFFKFLRVVRIGRIIKNFK